MAVYMAVAVQVGITSGTIEVMLLQPILYWKNASQQVRPTQPPLTVECTSPTNFKLLSTVLRSIALRAPWVEAWCQPAPPRCDAHGIESRSSVPHPPPFWGRSHEACWRESTNLHFHTFIRPHVLPLFPIAVPLIVSDLAMRLFPARR